MSKKNPMKKRLSKIPLVAGLAALLLLTACFPSVNPLYTPETIVFREELLGVWKEEPQDEESWTFEKDDENSYTVTISDEEETASKFKGHLVKLGEQLYLDLFPDGDAIEAAKLGDMYQVALIPGHLILKVKIGQELELAMLDPDKLKKFLEANPKALAHGYPQQEHLVITASTEDLQAFLKNQAEKAGLWGDPGKLKKLIL